MLWLKALHIASVVAWFAGLFYLPRLFVYHADTHDDAGHARFVTMERRLFAMMSVGGVSTLISGLWLAFGWWTPLPGWLQLKLVLVAALVAHHALCWRYLRAFAARRDRHTPRFYRIFNELPTLVLLGAVLLVVLKPAL